MQNASETTSICEVYCVKAVQYRRLNEEYEAFSKAAGLQPQYERGNIAEFGSKEAQKAQKTAKILQTSRKMV